MNIRLDGVTVAVANHGFDRTIAQRAAALDGQVLSVDGGR